MSDRRRHSHAVPVVFGDVVSIRYSDGDRVLGGQAFGIAWHLRGLGVPGVLITRVAADDAGRDAVRALEQWEIDTRGVQVGRESSTRAARLEPGPAGPRVRVPEGQPWDGISAGEALDAVPASGCALIVHGARCLRTTSNRGVLEDLIEACGAPVFFDAGDDACALDRPTLERCLARSSWVSLQARDLPAIAARLALEASDARRVDEQLRAAYDIDVLFVVADVQGAHAVTDGGRHRAVLPAGDFDAVDCVGVEEAFAAVAAYGIMSGWPLATCLRRAQGFVELIAALPMPEIPSGAFYQDVLEQWAAEPEGGPPEGHASQRATAAIPKQTRLPAELEQAARDLDALEQRQASARMKEAVASQQAAAGGADAGEALDRARRSVRTLEERIGETERRLLDLKRAARTAEGHRAADDANVELC